jgi:hypothetical protein
MYVELDQTSHCSNGRVNNQKTTGKGTCHMIKIIDFECAPSKKISNYKEDARNILRYMARSVTLPFQFAILLLYLHRDLLRDFRLKYTLYVLTKFDKFAVFDREIN